MKVISNSLYFEDFDLGDVIISPTRTMTEADITFFAGLTGDNNLMHMDEEFARRSIFGTRIAHGLLGLSMGMGLFQRLGMLSASGMAYLGVSKWEFLKPIKIGDTIHSKAEVLSKRETKKPDRGLITFGMSVYNQRDEEVQRGEHLLMVATRKTVQKD